MSNTSNSRLMLKNRLLSTLPVEEFNMLKPHLESVSFSAGSILYRAGDSIRYVYFPNNGMISLLSVTEQGNTVEVGFTGFKGMIGIPAVLGKSEMPYQAVAQVAADCFRVEVKEVKKLFSTGGVFHDSVLTYVYIVLKQLSQTCVCNHFHTIEARLSRWLTVMSERSADRHLALTQEFLSQMLGVQRTSVGLIANILQNRGIIRYSRGKIEIVDLDRLKGSVCECYHIVKADFDNYLKQK